MKGALAYEWRRIISVRSTYWFSGMAIVFPALIALAIALSFSSTDLTASGIATFFQASTLVVTAGGSVVIVPVVSAAFCAVIGAMSFGHEYRYGTVRQTLIALPDRATEFIAKLAVLVCWLLVLMCTVALLDMAIGWLFLSGFHLGGSNVRPIVDFILYNVGFGIAGFSLAAIFRNLAGALVAVLVYPFVLDEFGYNLVRLIRVDTLSRLANLFPASAGRRTIYSPFHVFANPTTDSGFPLHVWGLAASTAVYWCGLLIIACIAFALFLTRDA
jgi:hypothetical protein